MTKGKKEDTKKQPVIETIDEGNEEEEEEEPEEPEEVLDEEQYDEEEEEYEVVNDEEVIEENEEYEEEQNFDNEDDNIEEYVIEPTSASEIDIDSISERVPDSERITSPKLTMYEITRILGIRIQQLIDGAPSLVMNNIDNKAVTTAIIELKEKKTPFIIKRQFPYAKYELWKISEMEINISNDDIQTLIETIKY